MVFQKAHELLKDLALASSLCMLAGDDIDFKRGERAHRLSKRLADKAFEPVPLESGAISCRCADAESWGIGLSHIGAEEFADSPISLFRDFLEIAASQEAGCFREFHAASFFLPALRRRLMTLRPPGVFILARNPIDFFLRSLLG
jgi:hypothetical protein